MESLKCDVCEKTFANAGNLNRHKALCSSKDKPTLPCTLCDKVFSRNDNLKRHMADIHEMTVGERRDVEELQFQCPLCPKKYLTRKTLHHHISKGHADSGSPPLSSATGQLPAGHQSTTAQEQQASSSAPSYSGSCEKCQVSFSSTQEFAKHYLHCKFPAKTQEKIVYPRECSKCNSSHLSKSSYFKHTSKCGAEESSSVLSKVECIVEGCSREFFHRTRMAQHLVEDHGKTDMASHEYTFKSISDFEKWKQQTEGDSDTSFTAPCGKTETKTCIYRYFTCQLEAPNTTHCKAGTPARKTSRTWQTRGCIPKGFCCPARMLVKEDIKSKKVIVNFVESHNHDISYERNKYRKVPKATRDTIIALLKSRMEPKFIKLLLRGKVGALDQRDGQIKPRREHFIGESYIRRIKYNLKGLDRYNSNDLSSVDILVRCLMNTAKFKICDGNMKDKDGEDGDGVSEDGGNDNGKMFSSITVYKPQGKGVVLGDKSIDLLPNSKDLFLLGIQSREQLQMLQQGANKVVCIDFTYKLTQYDFYLCNIVVPDEFGKGYPVAHFITNKQDKETLAEALKSLKIRCSDLNINFLMTDDDQSEWQAMEMVFGPDIRRGICKYHLFRTWQRRLQSTDNGISDLKLRREVYHTLTVLCHERNQGTFMRNMETFITSYRPLCENFIKYFVKEYASRPDVWALCYRNFDHGCTDTNMYCESFHNKLKTFYLERRQNRRVDDLINILLEAEVDRYLEHLEMKLEGRVPSSVPTSYKKRHTAGINIKNRDVTTVVKSELWIVVSQTTKEEEYYVTRHSKECRHDHCFEKCTAKACPGLCCHMYTCTCRDASGICKHIHKVHSLSVIDGDYTPVESKISDTDFTGELHNPVEIEVNEVASGGDNNDPRVSGLEVLRSKCLASLDEIQTQIISSTSVAMLQFMSNQLRIASGHCNAFSFSSHCEQLEKLVPTLSVSGPQKVVPYKDLSNKFYRTTKKYVGSKENALTKPTFEERNERKRVLTSLADNINSKRIRNMGPSNTPSGNESEEFCDPSSLVTAKENIEQGEKNRTKVKSLSLKKPTDSRSFTPKLGFTNSIHQSVLFFNGQDGTLSSLTFRALKSIDPYLSSEECKNLSVKGLTGTMPSVFQRGWLFEEVVNFYLYSLCLENSEYHYFNSLFSQAVKSGGSIPAGVFQFNKTNVNTIFIPVNITDFHWTLFVCEPKARCFKFYDPSNVTCTSQYIDFLGKLCKAMRDLYVSIEKWSILCPPHALQTDTMSCGVYLCYYAHCIAKKKNTSEPMKDVSNFRQLIYKTLTGNCLKNKVYVPDVCVYCNCKVPVKDQVNCFNCKQFYHLQCVISKHPAVSVDNKFRCQ